MTPERQKIVGIVIFCLGLTSAGLVIAGMGSWFGLIAVFLGTVGGQQIGQAYARSKR